MKLKTTSSRKDVIDGFFIPSTLPRGGHQVIGDAVDQGPLHAEVVRCACLIMGGRLLVGL